MQNNPHQRLIDKVGEREAKRLLRDFYAQPENIPAFARLFDNHIPSYPPEFHREILKIYATTHGNVGGAAPRGFAKSTITSLVYLAWRTVNATSRFSILISDTYTQAVDLMSALKDEFETNPMLKWLYGGLQAGRWAEDDILVWGYTKDNRRVQCRIIALGAGMKVRGRKFKNFRPQLVIVDDLENDEAVQSKERREKLRKWLVRAVLPAIDRVIGRVILIGTILHKRSLLSAIIAGEGEFKSWTSFFYAGVMDGKTIWPEVYSTEEIYEWRDNPENPNYLGAVAWGQEIQNNPLDEGQRIIQPDWVQSTYTLAGMLDRYAVIEPDAKDLLGRWMAETFKLIHSSIDPAISEKETADYWAQVTIGITNRCPVCDDGSEGHIMVLDYDRIREGDPMKQVERAIDNYVLWRPDKVRVEAVAYQAGLVKLIRREATKQNVFIPLKPFKPLVSKVRRANVHAANFSGGLVHLRKDHSLYQAFVDELTEFPQGEHDDMFDAYMGAADISLKNRIAGTTSES